MPDIENPLMNGMIELEAIDDVSIERRDLFRGAGTLAAFLAAANRSAAQATEPDGRMPEAKPGPVLPLVPFGKHRITRLVAGANPIYGYSHFNYVFSAHMGDYHTTERVLSFLRELERAGLNTWQASWSERLETDWLKYKDQGGKLQLLLLSRPNFNDQPATWGWPSAALRLNRRRRSHLGLESGWVDSHAQHNGKTDPARRGNPEDHVARPAADCRNHADLDAGAARCVRRHTITGPLTGSVHGPVFATGPSKCAV